jgi:hypothetical protein
MAIITLLTDFGGMDEYVGVMKGVILGIAPTVQLVDISHQVAPQAVLQAAFLLRSAYPYFPAGTIHLVVVDPGVGSARRLIALKAAGHYFVAPDNGVLWPVIAAAQPCQAICLAPAPRGAGVSHTFHGRDILAPAAARLAAGEALAELGRRCGVRRMTRLAIPEPRRQRADTLIGEVLWVDHFGNLVTNIGFGAMEALSGAPEGAWQTRIAGRCIHGLSRCYAAVAPPEPLAIVGSRGMLEIAVYGGSAARMLNVAAGERVSLRRGKPARRAAAAARIAPRCRP